MSAVPVTSQPMPHAVATARPPLALVPPQADPAPGAPMLHLDGAVDEATRNAFCRTWQALADVAPDDERRARAVRGRTSWVIVRPAAPTPGPVLAEAVERPAPVKPVLHVPPVATPAPAVQAAPAVDLATLPPPPAPAAPGEVEMRALAGYGPDEMPPGFHVVGYTRAVVDAAFAELDEEA